MNMESLLRAMMAKGASDLHLKVGSFPHIRISGDLTPLAEAGKISAEDTLMMAFSIMNNQQKQRFRDQMEIDIAHGVKGLGRFRINVFQERGNVSLAIRAIPFKIPPLAQLHLPKVLEKITREPRGLILVTGATGSGKTTTLATMLDYINEHETKHIITIEDPIEYLHQDRMSIISQREISVDAQTFGGALRSSLRQDPDIILVGEMRDLETIETTLLAAETGHLVLSTLHTVDAVETVNRVIAVFPSRQQQQIRLQLAMVLRSIISLRLIRRTDVGGRVPASEVMISTEYIRNCILDPEKTKLIRQAIAAGTSQYGMQSFDQSLHEHFKAGRISYDDALSYATNPDEFKLRVQGIYTTHDSALESMESELTDDRP